MLMHLPDSLASSGFPGGSHGKESACNGGDWVRSLAWEDPLAKGLVSQPSILLPGESHGQRTAAG